MPTKAKTTIASIRSLLRLAKPLAFIMTNKILHLIDTILHLIAYSKIVKP